MKALDILSAVLLLIAGLTWGWHDLFGADPVAWLSGEGNVALPKIIHYLMGIAAIYQIISVRKIWARWRPKQADF